MLHITAFRWFPPMKSTGCSSTSWRASGSGCDDAPGPIGVAGLTMTVATGPPADVW